MRKRAERARAICLDGPLARVAVSRSVPEGETVAIVVQVEGRPRRAVYESLGACSEVPLSDGVGLRFIGYEGEETTSDARG